MSLWVPMGHFWLWLTTMLLFLHLQHRLQEAGQALASSLLA